AEARDVLERGLEAIGEHPALLGKAGAVSIALNDVASAMEYQERQLKVAPRYEDGWVALSTFAILAGKEARAEEAARTVMQLNDQRWQPYQLLGDIHDGRHEEAKAEEA